MGTFVAVYLINCKKGPVIGKVLDVTDDKVKIHDWKGTFKEKWTPHNAPRRQDPWVDALPKSCINLCSFSLPEESKLPSTRRHLQDEYAK